MDKVGAADLGMLIRECPVGNAVASAEGCKEQSVLEATAEAGEPFAEAVEPLAETVEVLA